MKIPARHFNTIATVAIAASIFVVGFFFLGKSQKSEKIDVIVPRLSAVASHGSVIFDANCAQCHGQHAAGTDKGPPLVHKIYVPSHHSDQSFFLAMTRGVRQHHWRFGNMPAQPQVRKSHMPAIVRYVRELQAANGIPIQP